MNLLEETWPTRLLPLLHGGAKSFREIGKDPKEEPNCKGSSIQFTEFRIMVTELGKFFTKCQCSLPCEQVKIGMAKHNKGGNAQKQIPQTGVKIMEIYLFHFRVQRKHTNKILSNTQI